MKKYFYLLKNTFINRLDYRQEMLMEVCVGLLYFAGQALLWKAIYSNREEINGFTYNEMMLYFIIARIASDIINSNTGFEIIDSIIKGNISNLLMKPVGIQRWYLFKEVGRIGPDNIAKLFVYLVIGLALGMSLSLSSWQLCVVIILFIPSFLISFLLNFLIGLIAFWITNAKSFIYALRRIMTFLAGGLVPLAFFPDFIQRVLDYTPFKYIFDLPMRVLFSQVEQRELLIFMVIQVIWVLFLWWGVNRIFYISIKHNESVGI